MSIVAWLLMVCLGGWFIVRLMARPGPDARVRRRPPPSRPPRHEPQPDVLGGWLVGHDVAYGKSEYPGDPLPDGHLGSPEDLAFWGSIFDDEDEESL
jgi:hypothetical protein